MVEKTKEKEEPTILVANELPQQPIRTFTEDGKEYVVVTVQEAIKEILEISRKLSKQFS